MKKTWIWAAASVLCISIGALLIKTQVICGVLLLWAGGLILARAFR